MTTRRASCSCGSLCVFCEGEPARVSICHCLACQLRSGSVFAVQARWDADRVRAEGEERTWLRVGDDGGQITHHFCPTCGSTVYYEIDVMPGIVAIPVGALGDPTIPSPSYSVYEARKHPWVVLPEGIEHMD